jgi:Tfp pilus assembly protein PilV
MQRGELKRIPDSGHWILGAAMKHQRSTIKHRGALRRPGFALYEVLLGVAIFAVGVLALGRAVENCMNASMLNAEEDAVRQILSNRMAEIQATRGAPDSAKEDKVDSGYGMVKLRQKSASAELTEPNNTQLNGIDLVILTAQWQRGGVSQSKQIKFYVYRPR